MKGKACGRGCFGGSGPDHDGCDGGRRHVHGRVRHRHHRGRGVRRGAVHGGHRRFDRLRRSPGSSTGTRHVRCDRASRPARDTGAVTVEAAIAIASIVTVVVLCIGAIVAVSTQVRCIDAAREAARLAAAATVPTQPSRAGRVARTGRRSRSGTTLRSSSRRFGAGDTSAVCRTVRGGSGSEGTGAGQRMRRRIRALARDESGGATVLACFTLPRSSWSRLPSCTWAGWSSAAPGAVRADLAALAAAYALDGGGESACAAASSIADRMRFELADCSVDGWQVVVATTVSAAGSGVLPIGPAVPSLGGRPLE